MSCAPDVAYTRRTLEELLEELASASEPLVAMLPRRPGQKETRWIHLVGEIQEQTAQEVRSPTPVAESLTSRVDELEERIVQLEAELRGLKSQLGE